MNALEQITHRLHADIGLCPEAVGPTAIRAAVRIRVEQRALRSVDDYAALLAHDEQEWQELIDEVVVSETWFFRDHEPFLALGRWAREQWLPAHPGEVLRILSVPCATGEEPFSIAMALLDAGIARDRFSIEAVDISQRALAAAAHGVYHRNSFRGRELGFRDRHFHPSSRGWAVNDAVRCQVVFRPGNALAPDFQPASPSYEAIFCRNLLIYFDAATQRRAVKLLEHRLAPDGLLFVGHAETGIFADSAFTPLPVPLAFAFARQPAVRPRRAGKTLPPAPCRAALRSGGGIPAPRAPDPRKIILLPDPRAQVAPPPPAPVAPPSLADAQSLANSGRLDEAARVCRDHLRDHGQSAEAFHLLGLIHDGAGRTDEAIACYRKALYLEPGRFETLTHLALLTRKSGDTAGAHHLQQRANRMKEKAA
jgi:chemotaxis protein methyltransferase WspC